MNISDFPEALDLLFKAKITPLITGHAGIGKSQTVKQYVKDGGHMMLDFRLGQMADPGDIIGLLDVESDASFASFKIPERIHNLIEFCKENPSKYGILNFDEINRGTKDLLQAVFQVVYDHELNGMVLPSNMRCVALRNPPTDEYDVLDFDDDAFADRFCELKFETSPVEWVAYARKNNIPAVLQGFITEQPSMLNPERTEFELKIKPSSRSFENVAKVYNLKDQYKNENVLTEVILGLVGTEAGTAFLNYAETNDINITAEEVLTNFAEVKPTIDKYNTVENCRYDIISNINSNIISVLLDVKEDKRGLSDVENENFLNYLEIIPADSAHSLLKGCIDNVLKNCKEETVKHIISTIKMFNIEEKEYNARIEKLAKEKFSDKIKAVTKEKEEAAKQENEEA